MPPKKTKQSNTTSKPANKPPPKAPVTFEDILASVSAPPRQVAVTSMMPGHASNLPDQQLESEVLIHEQMETDETEPQTSNEDDWRSDDEVEEELVVVEVNGFLDSGGIMEKVKEKLVTIRHPESERPTIQIGGQLYAGKYREPDGSIMVIEEHKEAENPNFTLTGITDLVIDAQKTYLFAKGEDESQPGEEVRKPIELRSTQRTNKALTVNIRKKN
ncbi:hypothetical protein FO519_007583 [Halicephalobus sp. NKZ332]|nr:hypothetical protein FO519_007583 [Halicephalobus sp. NKZ332]